MDFTPLLETAGDDRAVMLGGALVGLIFGFAAERSRFCLRAATVEFWRREVGEKTAIWLLAFGAALFGVQALLTFEALDAGAIRQLSAAGTLSGAVIGGLMFGAGMVLARGCASRLLVLSATGNMRALVTGLILTVVAQASLRGVLSPLRIELSSLAMVDGATRDLSAWLPAGGGVALGGICLAIAGVLAVRAGVSFAVAISSLAVGGAVALGWWWTSSVAAASFEVIPVESVSFTGPSADTLMAFINDPSVAAGFGLGLVPAVFAGSLISSVLRGSFQLQSFGEGAPMPRYVIGACLMGFGAMLAGGCAVGAGVTGGAVLSLTSWVALFAMWVGAGAADLLVDRRALAAA